MDTILNYHHAISTMKWKLFVMNLKVATMTWFKTIPNCSINSWKNLCDEFIIQFITRKWSPKIITILNRIYQKKKEILWEYIDKFIKVVIEVGGSNERLKCWIFEKGLRKKCMLHENLGLGADGIMNELSRYSLVIHQLWREISSRRIGKEQRVREIGEYLCHTLKFSLPF